MTELTVCGVGTGLDRPGHRTWHIQFLSRHRAWLWTKLTWHRKIPPPPFLLVTQWQRESNPRPAAVSSRSLSSHAVRRYSAVLQSSLKCLASLKLRPLTLDHDLISHRLFRDGEPRTATRPQELCWGESSRWGGRPAGLRFLWQHSTAKDGHLDFHTAAPQHSHWATGPQHWPTGRLQCTY